MLIVSTRTICQISCLLVFTLASGCATQSKSFAPERASSGRLIVAGKSMPVPFAVKTWKDEGGYDAHLETCFFGEETLPKDPASGCDTPRRYRQRPTKGLSPAARQTVTEEGWALPSLRHVVDQFVIHYDVCGTSRRCFEVLHDLRGLSVHFLLDVDGTLYQTLDLAHRARHAGSANDRSVGIEIAHFGAYPPGSQAISKYWQIDNDGIQIKLPKEFLPPAGGPFRPANPELIPGRINGVDLVQPDFTEAQYESLSRLTDALTEIFPKLERQVPRLTDGTVNPNVLSPEELSLWVPKTGKTASATSYDHQILTIQPCRTCVNCRFL
ncbi:MAG: N-acetylmuramoyl-L-alanine amidase [Planctomycetota bacterium]|jgi:N-acetylmuramoyl-L-alanine amidase